jgi:hypothetical protein
MRPFIRTCSATAAALLWAATAFAQPITVLFPAARSVKPLDGRVLLLLSNDPSAEPRMQIDDTPKSQMVFGVTVDGWKPGAPLAIGENAQGYPRASLLDTAYPTKEKSATDRVPSTAGMAIPTSRIGTRVFITTKCTCPKSWTALEKRRRPERT